jgi:hypothetical protein
MGMQGSLNRLTDALVQSLGPDGTQRNTKTTVNTNVTLTPSERASNIFSDPNELLSMEQRLFMLRFISDPNHSTTRDVFTGITNPQLRQAFVQNLHHEHTTVSCTDTEDKEEGPSSIV